LPDAGENDINAFVDKYYLSLLIKIIEMNVPKDITEIKKKDMPKIG
jgi:hypothetical protein